MLIINLTTKPITPKQRRRGVVDLPDSAPYKLLDLLTSNELTLCKRAEKIATLAQRSGCKVALVDAKPYFMPVLRQAMADAGIKVIHS